MCWTPMGRAELDTTVQLNSDKLEGVRSQAHHHPAEEAGRQARPRAAPVSPRLPGMGVTLRTGGDTWSWLSGPGWEQGCSVSLCAPS